MEMLSGPGAFSLSETPRCLTAPPGLPGGLEGHV